MENTYFLVCDVKNIDDGIIRISNSLNLKVLFVMIKYSDHRFNLSEISSMLNKNINDIEKSIEFWINLGIMNCVDSSQSENGIVENANNSYLSSRLKSGKDMSSLLDKIETLIGHPLSGADISMFTKFKDFDGLPSNVIIALVKYCIKIGKPSTRYIETVGNSWIKDGVNSIESAREKIKETDKMQSVWRKFEKIIGSNRMPSSKEKETIYKWFITWNYDVKVIQEAYDRCIDTTGTYKLNYMDGIIKTWKNNNVRVIEDVEKKRLNNLKCKQIYDVSKYEDMDAINWS